MKAIDTKAIDQKIIDKKVIEGDVAVLGVEKMQQIFGLFEQSSREVLDELKQAAESENSREVKSLVHKLKGSAGSLGLIELHHACQAIEADVDPLNKYLEQPEQLPRIVQESNCALQAFSKSNRIWKSRYRSTQRRI